MFLYGRKQYNIVKKLFSNFKKLEIYIYIFQDLIPLFSKYIISNVSQINSLSNQYYIRSFQLKHIIKGGEQITNKVKPWMVLFSNKRWLGSNGLSFSPIDHYLGLKIIMKKVISSPQIDNPCSYFEISYNWFCHFFITLTLKILFSIYAKILFSWL